MAVPRGTTAAPKDNTTKSATKPVGKDAAESAENVKPIPVIIRPNNVEPFAFWDDYCKKNPITAIELLPNLEGLRRHKRFLDIQAALTGFLRYRAKDPEPWLYELLAEAIALNKGKPEDVKAALTYAAKQAVKTGRPLDLTRVADNLATHHMEDQVGPLLDRAIEIDPGNPRAILMSLALAGRAKDPKRMATALEQLLSLGWPGTDEVWRLEARKRAESLAKTLKEDGREADAQTLLDHLKEAETRDLVLILNWKGDAGLDLAVEEPLGATAKPLTPRTVFGGAIIKDGQGTNPEDIYVCPRGFDGEYNVKIEALYNDAKNPVRTATLTILTHEGTPEEHREVKTIDVANPKPIVVHLDRGRRKQAMPYQGPPLPPPPTANPPGTQPPPAKEG